MHPKVAAGVASNRKQFVALESEVGPRLGVVVVASIDRHEEIVAVVTSLEKHHNKRAIISSLGNFWQGQTQRSGERGADRQWRQCCRHGKLEKVASFHLITPKAGVVSIKVMTSAARCPALSLAVSLRSTCVAWRRGGVSEPRKSL